MKRTSPFSENRFEYEHQHSYYLPGRIFTMLENLKPTYLIGSRGTGKTTLLQALSAKERLDNTSLRVALDGKPFASRCAGVYMKVPKFEISGFDEWLSAEYSKDLRAALFGFYLDLSWLEILLKAVAQLLVENIIQADPQQEYATTQAILSDYPFLRERLNEPRTASFLELAGALRAVRRELESHSKIRSDPSGFLPILPTGQVGSFGRDAGAALGDFCKAISDNANLRWHFKICMDEAECLSRFQQLVLNTIIRLSEWPVFHIISFVREMKDGTSTLYPAMSLQEADRHLVSLDDMSQARFKEFAEGVATVRVQGQLKDFRVQFKTTDILGKLDVNALLNQLLKSSENPKARQLLKKAKEFKDQPFFRSKSENKNNEPERSLPIYQTYLVTRQALDVPDPGTPGWVARRQQSAEIRKRMVSAYLCICKEFRMKVWYAFSEMLLQMSDSCIRDFLAQLDHMFLVSTLDLEDFLVTPIPITKQHNALKAASEQKRDSLERTIAESPLPVKRIVDALARITTAIQTTPVEAALSTSERGIFVLERSEGESPVEKMVIDLLKKGSDAGFLRLLSSSGRKVRLRVHRSLAAAYEFSYRGPYYETQLPPRVIHRISKEVEPEDFEALVQELSRSMSGQGSEVAQISLPLGGA